MRNSLFYLFPHLFKYACVISVLLFLWLLSFSTFAATYEDDLSFIKQYDTPIILSADQGTKQIIISAKHQARVMTSSANGMSGLSNGWFDYQAIKNNKSSGGEDRFWLAPIGTKHSLYYPQGEHFVGEQWFVPKAFSSQVYPLVSVTPNTALFKTELRVNNMSGTAFYVNLKRKITLFDVSDVAVKLNIPVDVLEIFEHVAFGSDNTMTNLGQNFNSNQDAVTIWILGTFHGTENTTAIIPVQDKKLSTYPIKKYLNSFDNTRLKQRNNVVFFKVDGRYRSKIGISSQASSNIMATYHPEFNRLTVVKFSISNAQQYPIAVESDVPLNSVGDITNIYNHGGIKSNNSATPFFFELESAAAMKPLKHNESIRHQHDTFHFFGKPSQLSLLTQQLLALDIDDINAVFSSGVNH